MFIFASHNKSIISNSSIKQRIFGLDLLRFAAIFYVLLGHSKILLPSGADYTINLILLDGVSIFFVLSGFLIGKILLKQLERSFNSQDLFRFWTRRWLRTLPVYLLVLTTLIVYTQLLKPERLPDDWWRYYLFIQNCFVPQPAFFSEAWSLSVEEWFYLLIPILFFAFYTLFKQTGKSLILWIVILVIIAVTGWRWYLYLHLNTHSFREIDLNILRQVPARLDAIMCGVAAAFLSLHYRTLWQKMAHWSFPLIALMVLYVLKPTDDFGSSWYYVVLVPLLKGLVVVFALPFLSQWRLQQENPMSWLITRFSLWSYSMYLINRTIIIDIIFKYLLYGELKGRHVTGAYYLLEYILFWVLTPLLAFVLYRWVEQPVLNWRDRITREV